MQALQQIVETYVLPLQLVLAMFGMGASLSVRDFLQVAREARGVVLGLTLQLIFMPLLAVGFIEAFDLSKGWAVGLLLVTVVPGGVFSNLLTYLGRGNIALSVSLTVTTTLVCLLTTPTLLELFAGRYLSETFVMPSRQIVRDISLFLLLPLAVGMVLHRMDPARARPTSRWLVRVSTWLLGLVVFSSLGSGRIELHAYGWRPPLMLALFGTTVAVAIPLLCRALRRFDEDTVALSIEVSVRNVGLGLFLVRFFFPGEPEQAQVLYTLLYYGGMQLLMGLPIALRYRHGKSPLLLLPARPAPKPPA